MSHTRIDTLISIAQKKNDALKLAQKLVKTVHSLSAEALVLDRSAACRRRSAGRGLERRP
jgi:hypothetical protein